MTEKQKISAGSRAPLFTLKDGGGAVYALKDMIGRQPVILIFYPGDMTPGCTVQLRAVRNDWKQFEDAGATVVGINHANADSHKAFSERLKLPFPLLIDTGKRVSAAYGAVKPFFKTSLIMRTVVGVGTDGIIFFYKRGMPKDSEILKQVKQVKAGETGETSESR